MKEKVILLFSGGMDSTTARAFLKPDLTIYFDINGKYSIKELTRIFQYRDVIISKRLELGGFEYGRTAFLPFRNMIFAMIAYNIALRRFGKEYDIFRIAIVGIKGDNVPDKNPNIFKEMSEIMNKMLKEGFPKVEIFSPFWQLTKSEVIRLALKLNVNLKNVVSCYDDKTDGLCGKCPACFRFWVGLENAGVENPLQYFENDPRKWEGIKYYKKNLSKYDEERQKEIKFVLEKYKL